jgi:hypothetical protein
MRSKTGGAGFPVFGEAGNPPVLIDSIFLISGVKKGDL